VDLEKGALASMTSVEVWMVEELVEAWMPEMVETPAEIWVLVMAEKPAAPEVASPVTD